MSYMCKRSTNAALFGTHRKPYHI